MPMQAFLLALVGALVLAKVVVSWITFLAETFAFGGSSVSLYERSKAITGILIVLALFS